MNRRTAEESRIADALENDGEKGKVARMLIRLYVRQTEMMSDELAAIFTCSSLEEPMVEETLVAISELLEKLDPDNYRR